MYKKQYLCHCYQEEQLVGSVRFDTRNSLKEYLRRNNAHFTDSCLNDLGEDSVEIETENPNIYYEVEALADEVPDYIVDGKDYFCVLPLWAKQHNMTTKQAHNIAYRLQTIKANDRVYVKVV